MRRKKEAHEEENTLTPLLTVDKLLKFALDKYTCQSRIYNHVWESSPKREAEAFALVAEVTMLKGNIKLTENIENKKKPNGGG